MISLARVTKPHKLYTIGFTALEQPISKASANLQCNTYAAAGRILATVAQLFSRSTVLGAAACSAGIRVCVHA